MLAPHAVTILGTGIFLELWRGLNLVVGYLGSVVDQQKRSGVFGTSWRRGCAPSSQDQDQDQPPYRYLGSFLGVPLQHYLHLLDHQSRRSTATLLRRHVTMGPKIGKPEELMNWITAGLKRGPLYAKNSSLLFPGHVPSVYYAACYALQRSLVSLTSLTSHYSDLGS